MNTKHRKIEVVFWDLGETLLIVLIWLFYRRMSNLFGASGYVLRRFLEDENMRVWADFEKGPTPKEIYYTFVKNFWKGKMHKVPSLDQFTGAFNSMIAGVSFPEDTIALLSDLSSMMHIMASIKRCKRMIIKRKNSMRYPEFKVSITHIARTIIITRAIR